jgi:hypothetical protein
VRVTVHVPATARLRAKADEIPAGLGRG